MVDILPRPSDDNELQALIETHRAFCRLHTPEGSGHAVVAGSSDVEDVRYWVAQDGDQLLGCIGFRMVEPGHGEIKTMHVLDMARGRGVGAGLIGRVLAVAREEGFARVSLETGRSDGFAASRRLYGRAGFEPCPPFGDYTDDPFSYCMTRIL